MKVDVHVAVVMPDHVHMIFTPLINETAGAVYSLGEVTDAIKGASAHLVNRALDRKGKVWQTESFDRVLRSSEKLDEKIDSILQNPVRAGLVASPEYYPWLWAPSRIVAAQ